MKIVLLVVALMAAVASAQISVYTAWSPSTCPASCVQTRSYAGICQGTLPTTCTAPSPINILTQQSCTGGDCTSPLPSDWDGTYTVTNCNVANPVSLATACCCLPSTVYVRKFDELIEVTADPGQTMKGAGCSISTAAAAPPIGGSLVSPVGISFKTPASFYPANFNAAVAAALPPSLSVALPKGSTADLTWFGRTARVVRTAADKIYVFGVAETTLPNENPFCVQELTRQSTSLPF